MIVVAVDEDDVIEFESATRYSTDEHNNLQIWSGRDGEELVQVFATGFWQSVGVAGED